MFALQLTACCLAGCPAQAVGSSWAAASHHASSPYCWHERQRFNSISASFCVDTKSDLHRPLYQVSRLRIQLQSCPSTLCPEFDQPRLCCVAHSPHIKAITERIVIDGAQISETDFAGLAAQDSPVMQQALQGSFGSLSHFEVLTSLAFKHFQRKQVFQSPVVSHLCLCLCILCHIAVPSLQVWQEFAILNILSDSMYSYAR